VRVETRIFDFANAARCGATVADLDFCGLALRGARPPRAAKKPANYGIPALAPKGLVYCR